MVTIWLPSFSPARKSPPSLTHRLTVRLLKGGGVDDTVKVAAVPSVTVSVSGRMSMVGFPTTLKMGEKASTRRLVLAAALRKYASVGLPTSVNRISLLSASTERKESFVPSVALPHHAVVASGMELPLSSLPTPLPAQPPVPSP